MQKLVATRCEITQLHSWAKPPTGQGPEWHTLRIRITGIQGVAHAAQSRQILQNKKELLHNLMQTS